MANKNTKAYRAKANFKFAPRKSTKPKVAASAERITEQFAKSGGYGR